MTTLQTLVELHDELLQEAAACLGMLREIVMRCELLKAQLQLPNRDEMEPEIRERAKVIRLDLGTWKVRLDVALRRVTVIGEIMEEKAA